MVHYQKHIRNYFTRIELVSSHRDIYASSTAQLSNCSSRQDARRHSSTAHTTPRLCCGGQVISSFLMIFNLDESSTPSSPLHFLDMLLRNRTRLKPFSRDTSKRKQKTVVSTSNSPNSKKSASGKANGAQTSKTIVKGKAGRILRSMTKRDLEGLVVRLSCEVKRLQKVICCQHFQILINQLPFQSISSP